MEEFAIYATMKARAGKEREVEALLESLLIYAEAESGTKHWFALRGHDRTYSIFDTFDDETSRESHLQGRIAEALLRHASRLFESDPQIVTLQVVAEKEEREERELTPS